MKFLRNLHSASEILFFLLGGAYLVAYIFYRNNFYVYPAEIYIRLADIPFAFICIIFAATGLRMSFNHQLSTFEEKRNDQYIDAPLLDAFLFIFGLILFMMVLFMNFTFLDQA